MMGYTKQYIGQAPGTLVHIGEIKAEKVTITMVDYYTDHFESKKIDDVKDIFHKVPRGGKRWINIAGLHDTDLIAQVGEYFKIHPIALENIVNTTHKTSFDDYDDFLHIIANSVYWNQDNTSIEKDQFSIVMTKNCLITFVEEETDIFEPILKRLQKPKSRFCKLGLDYLAYAVLDLIVDNFFVVIENVEDRVEALEEVLIGDPEPDTLREIQQLKRNLIFLRKSVWPYREVVSAMQASDSDLVSDDITIYVKNLYDHTVQAIDIIETFRDMVSGMLDIYLSSVSNEMNKVMKVLTVIATVFIPITFISGVYGMNFNTKFPFNMPELGWRYGYLFALGMMAIIALTMLIYFKRKKWF
ncbi:MAG: magnesium/cobalt transporter CorA [Gammaproteobacteria bacterium]|nr:magnesium/cobalt transporter CorA [Gammaproteobacteria bacterium]